MFEDDEDASDDVATPPVMDASTTQCATVAHIIDTTAPAVPLEVSPPPLVPSKNDASHAVPPSPVEQPAVSNLLSIPPTANDWTIVGAIRHQGRPQVSARSESMDESPP